MGRCVIIVTLNPGFAPEPFGEAYTAYGATWRISCGELVLECATEEIADAVENKLEADDRVRCYDTV